MKKFTLFALAAALFCVGCEKPETVVPVETVTLNQTELTLALGETAQLAAAVTPLEADAVIVWSSDNEAVATVDENGLVAAVAVGTANIKAEAGEKFAECAVTVYDPTKLVYGGVTYNLVTLADGNTWMAENLRYVPAGKTASADPTEAAGIWYPYTFDGTNCVAATDEETVSKSGLFYNAATAFGVDAITADNAASFAGTQGICPDGYHIPTFEELLNLVGKSAKISSAAVGGWEAGSTPENKNALFYNADYDGGKISEINESGFNFVFCGSRNGAGSGSYMKPVAAYPTMPMTYIWGSTVYDPAGKTIQFMSLMSTATTAYPEGRLTVGFNNNTNGCAVRCVKNK